jgi:hypothetical protein
MKRGSSAAVQKQRSVLPAPHPVSAQRVEGQKAQLVSPTRLLVAWCLVLSASVAICPASGPEAPYAAVGGQSVSGVSALGSAENASPAPELPAGTEPASDQAEYVTESIRGRVVWMSAALKRRFGINLVREANERVLALETTDGQLLPIMEDVRGRSFRMDKRLREMEVELLVRRYQQLPMLQVIRVYELKDDTKYVVDYWCDVCAIVMFQLGPCDCCQDTNRLRVRPFDEVATP